MSRNRLPKTRTSIGSLIDGQEPIGCRSDTSAPALSLARHSDAVRGLAIWTNAIVVSRLTTCFSRGGDELYRRVRPLAVHGVASLRALS